ncbi:FAD-dependent oxidoreductase [Pseudohalocynthiibacter aestuariivivens]|uniref:FAD-dependent oxidoreductase n=1 Tax=Pseudohalocynthiibacter aestuariivivens TaxID=1591409 RepID=A0ABV5JDK9_9RHOB|nr:FAD-binding oxidoreductase [Pseudohalocynthiibacter aestuariivivens]
MKDSYDALIIGTGVIGTAIAFEMAKAGWKTLSLDRNSQIGHGSTAGSCAIIRMHYSTFDGTAFAWEGYHYWQDWADYLRLPNDADLAKFKECGCLVMKTSSIPNQGIYRKCPESPYISTHCWVKERPMPAVRLEICARRLQFGSEEFCSSVDD